MNKNELYAALKLLRQGTPESKEAVGGYCAVVRFPVCCDQVTLDIFNEFFHCEEASPGVLILSIVANDQRSIIYEHAEIALLNAVSYYGSLEKKFIFQCYRQFGVKLDVPAESVVTFITRAKK